MTTELTKQDHCDWNLQKAICERHLIPLMETAQALKAIRDRKLWRVQHDSFEEFIESLYGRSLSWANSLIVKQIGPATYSSGENTRETGKNPTGDTNNNERSPDDTTNEVSEVSEASPSEARPSAPRDPFKKLDALIGQAIREVDELGSGTYHAEVRRLFTTLLDLVKQWRATA